MIGVWHANWRTWARDTGIIAGSSEYIRFVVLGRSRTGSTFLRGLLNSHSRIIAFGEILGGHESISWDVPGYTHRKRMSALLYSDPTSFLEKGVFRKFPAHISAVGFKIFYYHAQDGILKPVWAYLGTHKELRIIHVKRANILETHLSRKRAVMSGHWVNISGTTEEYAPITLSYEECLDAFTRTRAWERKYDTFFENHFKIDVLYENLSSDYVSEMKRIQDFLGVDYEVTKPTTYKQRRVPLAKAILNYHELKERFHGTPWTEFFSE